MGPGNGTRRPTDARPLVPALEIILAAVLTVGALVCPAVAEPAELRLVWVDNSGGAAGVKIERKLATDGTFVEIAAQAPGVFSYTDATVVSGATYCYRVKAYNEAMESAYSSQTCGTPGAAAPPGLDVAVAVAGSGVVTSSPAGIACETDCTESFASGTVVTLTAMPAAGAVFTGWSGGRCSGTAPCTVTGNAPVTVTATFGPAPAPAPATVTLRVNGDPASGPYTVEAQTTVAGDIRIEFWVDGTLRQTESNGPYYLFGDTGGVPILATIGAGSHAIVVKVFAQTGSTVRAEGQITVTEVTVAVAPPPPPPPPATYTLTASKQGSGTVRSVPAGIVCGTDCVGHYANGTVVTLTATPAAGAVFTGWSGGGCSGTAPCTVRGSASVTVTATFGPAPATVTLRVVGDPASGPYTVEARTTVAGDIRIQFWVDGTLRQTQNSGPYYLFGDTGGVPVLATIGAGSHGIVAKVFAQIGSTVRAEGQITVTEGTVAAPSPRPPPPPPSSPPATYTLTVATSGSGTVVSTPAGIACGPDCVEPYATGTVVTLTAMPAAGAVFTGWSGGGCSGTALCTVTGNGTITVTATFELEGMERPALLEPGDRATVAPGGVVTFAWTRMPGATQYGLEYTGTNRRFANPNGTAPDGVNGFGGAGGGFLVAATTLTLALPTDVPMGTYQVRVIGLSGETLLGTFSDALTIVVGTGTSAALR